MDCSNYNHLLRLTPYELHKKLINHYVLRYKGTTSLLKRDTSRDKRDIDIIRENHKFLWDDSEADTWEKRLAKKYYDKLYKEYCICDLSHYKENKVAMRWQIEQELVTGKGQFVCGEKQCQIKDDLKTWEVNFGYVEHGEKKNALVKLRLCPNCSMKLNFKHKRKEVKRDKKLKRLNKNSIKDKSKNHIINNKDNSDDKNDQETSQKESVQEDPEESNIWKESNTNLEEPSRDEEFEDYLEHLLL